MLAALGVTDLTVGLTVSMANVPVFVTWVLPLTSLAPETVTVTGGLATLMKASATL